MAWKCSGCLAYFTEDDKKYKWQLCKTCYFNPETHKAFRTGERQQLSDESAVTSAEPPMQHHEPDPYCMVQEQMSKLQLGMGGQVKQPELHRQDLTDEEKRQLIKNGWADEPRNIGTSPNDGTGECPEVEDDYKPPTTELQEAVQVASALLPSYTEQEMQQAMEHQQLRKLELMMSGKLGGLKSIGLDFRRLIERERAEQSVDVFSTKGAETYRYSAANPPQTAMPKLENETDFSGQVRDMLRRRHPGTPLQCAIIDLEKQVMDLERRAPAEVWDRARENNKILGCMPDITVVALDILKIKLMLLKVLKHIGVDLTPDVLVEFASTKGLKPIAERGKCPKPTRMCDDGTYKPIVPPIDLLK